MFLRGAENAVGRGQRKNAGAHSAPPAAEALDGPARKRRERPVSPCSAERRLPPLRVGTEFSLSCNSTQKHSVRIETHDGLGSWAWNPAVSTELPRHEPGEEGKPPWGPASASAAGGSAPPSRQEKACPGPSCLLLPRSAGPRNPKPAAELPRSQDKLLKQQKRTTEQKLAAEYFHIPPHSSILI